MTCALKAIKAPSGERVVEIGIQHHRLRQAVPLELFRKGAVEQRKMIRQHHHAEKPVALFIRDPHSAENESSDGGNQQQQPRKTKKAKISAYGFTEHGNLSIEREW